MEIKIKETGEVKELPEITAYDSGIAWTNGLLGNHGALHYDHEEEIHVMGSDDFEWWSELIPALEAADHRYKKLLEELEDTDDLQKDYGIYTACDLDDLPSAINYVCTIHESIAAVMDVPKIQYDWTMTWCGQTSSDFSTNGEGTWERLPTAEAQAEARKYEEAVLAGIAETERLKEEAVGLFRKKDYGDALILLEKARQIEVEWGDDPSFGPLLEQLHKIWGIE